MPPQSCRHHIFHCCSSIAIFKTCHCSHTTLHHHSHTHTLIVILLQIWITVKSHEPCRSKPWVSSKHRICLDVNSSNCYHSKFCDKVTAVISYTCPSMTLFHILKVKFRWTSNKCFHDETPAILAAGEFIMETFDWGPPKFYFEYEKCCWGASVTVNRCEIKTMETKLSRNVSRFVCLLKEF